MKYINVWKFSIVLKDELFCLLEGFEDLLFKEIRYKYEIEQLNKHILELEKEIKDASDLDWE